MVFNGNYSVSAMLAPAAILVSSVGAGFIPVCGAMRRNHLIKE